MELIQKYDTRIRIQFGSTSISFGETTVDEVYRIAKKVFENVRVDRTVHIKDHLVTEKVSKEDRLSFTVLVKEIDYSKHKNTQGAALGSKSFILNAISQEYALELFKNNYQKYINN